MNTITSLIASAFDISHESVYSVVSIYSNGDCESWHSLDVVT